MAPHREGCDIAHAVFGWFDQNGAQGILITDAQLIIRGWNRWLVDATGSPAEVAVGRPLFDVLPSLVERGFARYYADALNGQVKVLSHAFHRYLIPTIGAPLWGAAQMPQAAQIGPLHDAAGCAGTITVLENVSERVATEQLLRNRIATAETASRAKDEFLATLSHEIRTPLNAVLGWTRILLSRSELDPDMVKRAVEVIDRNASAQLTLVSDMLDTARISSGKVRLETTDVNMGAIAIAAIDAVRPAADAKGVRLVTNLGPQIPAVSGDADRLLQVIWNLLSNSVKFTDTGGEIALDLHGEGSYVSLVVSDTGQGIDPAFLPHVFERFKQADPSSSRRYGGLGLGLALVKDLVELHGGTVSAVSGGLGLGATFSIRLPARDASPRRPTALGVAAGAGVGTLSGVNVLIVDDDLDALEIVTHAVVSAGGMVVAARSADEAVVVLKEAPQPPHVIVTDIGMPDADGYTFLRNLRSLPSERGGALPVIALTAYDSPEDRVRALRAGFAAHFGKPFIANVLVAAINRAATQTAL